MKMLVWTLLKIVFKTVLLIVSYPPQNRKCHLSSDVKSVRISQNVIFLWQLARIILKQFYSFQSTHKSERNCTYLFDFGCHIVS